MGFIISGEKFLRLQNPAMQSQKKENTEKKSFRVPMHFRTNRFTSKNNLPPPPLLHPMVSMCRNSTVGEDT